jgi:hypothetical protein
MRLGAGLTRAKLTLFFRSSTTGWTTDSEYLFGTESSLYGKKIMPQPVCGMVNLEQFRQLLNPRVVLESAATIGWMKGTGFQYTGRQLPFDPCGAYVGYLDIETEWTLNALLTTSSSYRKCSKRRTFDHPAQATSLLPIEGTTRCSRIVRGFSLGSGMGSAAEPSLLHFDKVKSRAKPPQ